MAEETRRKFVWAPDMDKLRARIQEADEAAQEAIRQAEDMAEEIEEAQDLKQRLAHVVLAVRDRQNGLIDERSLNDEIARATEGIEWPDFIAANLSEGRSINRRRDAA